MSHHIGNSNSNRNTGTNNRRHLIVTQPKAVIYCEVLECGAAKDYKCAKKNCGKLVCKLHGKAHDKHKDIVNWKAVAPTPGPVNTIDHTSANENASSAVPVTVNDTNANANASLSVNTIDDTHANVDRVHANVDIVHANITSPTLLSSNITADLVTVSESNAMEVEVSALCQVLECIGDYVSTCDECGIHVCLLHGSQHVRHSAQLLKS